MIKITRSFKVDVPEVALSDFIEDLPFADSKDGIHIPQPEGVRWHAYHASSASIRLKGIAQRVANHTGHPE